MTTSRPTLRPSVDPTLFTQALSQAANSVTVVTTDGTGGKAGLTVSSMCSVCAEPPVILACVNQENEFCAAVSANQCFCVNLLCTIQTDVAQVFAGLETATGKDRFLTGNWKTLTTGSPVLSNALVSLDCELSTFYPHGTHNIYIGKVVDVSSRVDDALVYCSRRSAQVHTLDT